MPYSKSPMKKSSCIKMYDGKGKPSGLMMEGSVAHMESADQEKKNLMKDMPVDDKASALEMSPYKLTEKDKPEPKPFMDPGPPEGFTSDAPEVTGTRILSDLNLATKKTMFGGQQIGSNERVQEIKGARKKLKTPGTYTQAEKDIHNKMIRKGTSDYVNPFTGKVKS